MKNIKLKGTSMKVRDFSNPKDAQEVLEELGGEALLKEQYPKVYDAYLKTIEKHKKDKELLNNDGDDIGGKNSEGLENGVFTSAVTLKPYNENNKNAEVNEGCISAAVSVQGNENWSVAYIRSYIEDTSQNNKDDIIVNLNKDLNGENYFEGVLEKDNVDINKFNGEELISKIECHALLKSEGTMVSLKSECDEYIMQNGSLPISNINLQHPRSYVNNIPIIIMYARSPIHGEHIDYDYPNNTMVPGTRKVKTLLPVKGKIIFNNGIKPVGFDKNSSNTKPMLKFKGNGVSYYNHSQEEIASCFKIANDNSQCVEFQLNDDWNDELDISLYSSYNEGEIAFEYSFYITVQVNGSVCTYPQLISIYSMMGRSHYYESYNESTVQLPNIYIRWGCFAKDTRILLSNGTRKAVSELKIGDELQVREGNTTKIKDIVIGDEENIICIQTKGHKLLKVTRTHPLMTTYGTIVAEEVRPGMNLICTDDSQDEVEFIYTTNYNDKVYSIITAKGNQWIDANGIWAGDFDLQNKHGLTEKEEEPMSDHVKAVTEEFGQLINYLKTK